MTAFHQLIWASFAAIYNGNFVFPQPLREILSVDICTECAADP